VLRNGHFFDSEAEKVVVRFYLRVKEKKMKKKSNKFLAVLLALMMAVVFMPTLSFADTPDEEVDEPAATEVQPEETPDTPAVVAEDTEESVVDEATEVASETKAVKAAKGSVTVNCAIANKGKLVVKNQNVKVTDVNKNGKFDIYDTFYKIHKAKKKKFAVKEGQITKFWSVKTTVVGYMLNDDSAGGLDDEVADGDYLYGFVYKDQPTYSDQYTSITDANGKRTSTYPAYEGVDLTLSVYGYDPDNDWAFGKVDYDYSKATITVNGKDQDVPIAEDGTFHIDTPKASKYTVSVKAKEGILTPACYQAVAKAASGKVTVNCAIANKGKLVVKNQNVKVTDVNKNGKFDIYDTFYKIHKAKKKKFAVKGGSITKFWSVKTSFVGYMLNDNSSWSTEDEVANGDYLYGFIYKDQASWSDQYTAITDANGKRTSTYPAYEGVDLTLSVYGYDPDNDWAFGKIDYDYSKATITVNGKDQDVPIAEDGTFHIDTPKAGKYTVSVKAKEGVLTPACYQAVAKEGKAAKGSVKVNCAIANQGELVVKNQNVKVTDVNKNGKFDIYDTFYTIHEAKKKKFAVQNGQITKFWSVKTTAIGYMLNDNYVWSLDDEVANGDYLYGFIYKDQEYWSDKYTAITDANGKRTSTVKTSAGIDLTLSVYGFDPNTWEFGRVDYDYSKATITVNGEDQSVVIAEDGTFHIDTPKAGTFNVSVKANEGVLTPACYQLVVEK